ncbi:hypothetical protein LEP1GSC005_3865 [Leptospira santarosai str. ST188]|nr:hypothetical protein LEP1GSC005_3865 [Leptospira santarosai str. ST188]EMO72454.1 hypothetical protein LEP1GSC130_2055 [Leptospira santarosai str. 200403458]EMO98108.1 hypothetical protein LEP1GSC120_0796 [Leptospira santarosai str. 200702252]
MRELFSEIKTFTSILQILCGLYFFFLIMEFVYRSYLFISTE